MKFNLLLSIITITAFPGCASMATVEQLSNDMSYEVEIHNVKNAHLLENGDVEICFDGRVHGRLGRDGSNREYSFLVAQIDIKEAMSSANHMISVPSENIFASCLKHGDDLGQLSKLDIFEINERNSQAISGAIDYQIRIGESWGHKETYRVLDRRFKGHHKFDLKLVEIHFRGHPIFNVLYPIAFVLDFITFPIQVFYCTAVSDDLCGATM